MNQSKLFQDIYDDFFGIDKEVNIENKVQQQMSDLYQQVDALYVTDESKQLLKKIIEYMRKFNEKIENNYIQFSIVVDSHDRYNKQSIIDIIKSASFNYEYIDKKNIKEISFFHLDKDLSIDSIYQENGIIIFKDFSGFNLLNENEKRKIINDIYNNIKSNTITLFVASKEEIKDFLLTGKELKEYVSFFIDYKPPTVQDIYQKLIQKISLNEDNQVKLLDYITNTINTVEDYEIYEEKLYKELTFNKKVPVLEKQKTMDEIFKELNELVGLKNVKKALYELVDLVELKKKSKDTLKINNLNLHMVFLGNPGTGKTTVARIIADILYNLKYIKTNNLIEVSAKDLVAEYVGQTAPKTNAVIEKAKGGVLFIDEAYSLADNHDNSYNGEAIATLIQAMENYRDELVVIFAGYTKEMQKFLDSNSGIVSRIGYTLEFSDYTTDELIQIFKNFMKKSGFEVTDEAIKYLKTIINDNRDTENFGNARFVRNIYEKTIVSHAANTKGKKNKKLLITITKEDINTENLILK